MSAPCLRNPESERLRNGVQPGTFGSPWPDGIDTDRYNAIVRQVRDHLGGVPLSRLVQTIYGRYRVYEAVNGDQRPTAAYQRVPRAVYDLADRRIQSPSRRPDPTPWDDISA